MRWRINACVALLMLCCFSSALVMADAPADAKKATLTTAQQDAIAKIQAKGGLVIPLAANSDSLVVSLATAGKQAGDSELDLVKQLPKVTQLDLRNTAITDKGLADLQGMSSLESLHLEGTAITDAGLANLKGLTNLQYLNLFNTAVSDKGIADLQGLKNLKKLYVWETKVTASGVASLKHANPEVYVNRGEELAITTQPAQPIPEKAAVAAAATPAPAPAKPKAVTSAAPAAAATPAPAAKAPVAAAVPEINLEQTIAEAKAAIDAQANAAKASIDAQAAAAKAAIDARYLGAKATPQAATAKPINTKCPISGEAVNPLRTVVFEGKVIGLCCEKCQAKFAADPKKYIDKVVADAK